MRRPLRSAASAIDDFEAERRALIPAVAGPIRRAFEPVGVAFLSGEDVRLRPGAPVGGRRQQRAHSRATDPQKPRRLTRDVRPDHRGGIEFAAIDAHRAPEAAADLERGLDDAAAGEARRDRLPKLLAQSAAYVGCDGNAVGTAWKTRLWARQWACRHDHSTGEIADVQVR